MGERNLRVLFCCGFYFILCLLFGNKCQSLDAVTVSCSCSLNLYYWKTFLCTPYIGCGLVSRWLQSRSDHCCEELPLHLCVFSVVLQEPRGIARFVILDHIKCVCTGALRWPHCVAYSIPRSYSYCNYCLALSFPYQFHACCRSKNFRTVIHTTIEVDNELGFS